jgi:hypothetical protein
MVGVKRLGRDHNNQNATDGCNEFIVHGRLLHYSTETGSLPVTKPELGLL